MVSLLNVDNIPCCPLPSPCSTDGPLLGSCPGVVHYAHSRVVCGHLPGFPGERGWENFTSFMSTAGGDSRITGTSPQPAVPDSKGFSRAVFHCVPGFLFLPAFFPYNEGNPISGLECPVFSQDDELIWH